MNKAAGQPDTAKHSEGSEPRLIPFRIFRSDRAPVCQETSDPILHVNTLAQMLYEAFQWKRGAGDELIPGVILFREGVVEGLPGPGVYIPDFHKDAFRLTDQIDVGHVRQQFTATGLKSQLAVGYFQKIVQPEEEVGKLRGMSMELAQGLGAILSLHGDLIDYLETGPEHPELPLLSIQWIAEAK